METIETIRVLATSYCNLRCSHCYQHYEKNTCLLPFESLCEIADFAASHGTTTLILSGGEFFTHPDAYRFLTYCASMPFEVLVASNGTQIDIEYFRNTQFANGIHVQLSIDGMEAAHDARRGRGTFQSTTLTGTALAQLGIPVSISMALDDANIHDTIDVINLPFASSVKLLPVASVGAAENRLNSAGNKEIEDLLVALLRRQHEAEPSKLFPRELAISYTGDVFPSMVAQDMGVLNLGNIFTMPIEKIIKQAFEDNPYGILSFSTEGFPGCEGCTAKDVCNRGCRVRAYKTFGSLTAPDPLCCRLYINKYLDISIGNIFWGEISPRIETQHLILRRWQYSDVPALAHWLNSEQMANDYGTPYPYTADHAFSYIDDAIRNQKTKFAILLKSDHKLMGGCGIHKDMADTIASANIWIAQPFRRRGYAKEAGTALLQYGFQHCGITQFNNSCFEGNEASARLQESVGSRLSPGVETDKSGRARKHFIVTSAALNNH